MMGAMRFIRIKGDHNDNITSIWIQSIAKG